MFFLAGGVGIGHFNRTWLLFFGIVALIIILIVFFAFFGMQTVSKTNITTVDGSSSSTTGNETSNVTTTSSNSTTTTITSPSTPLIDATVFVAIIGILSTILAAFLAYSTTEDQKSSWNKTEEIWTTLKCSTTTIVGDVKEMELCLEKLAELRMCGDRSLLTIQGSSFDQLPPEQKVEIKKAIIYPIGEWMLLTYPELFRIDTESEKTSKSGTESTKISKEGSESEKSRKSETEGIKNSKTSSENEKTSKMVHGPTKGGKDTDKIERQSLNGKSKSSKTEQDSITKRITTIIDVESLKKHHEGSESEKVTTKIDTVSSGSDETENGTQEMPNNAIIEKSESESNKATKEGSESEKTNKGDSESTKASKDGSESERTDKSDSESTKILKGEIELARIIRNIYSRKFDPTELEVARQGLLGLLEAQLTRLHYEINESRTTLGVITVQSSEINETIHDLLAEMRKARFNAMVVLNCTDDKSWANVWKNISDKIAKLQKLCNQEMEIARMGRRDEFSTIRDLKPS